MRVSLKVWALLFVLLPLFLLISEPAVAQKIIHVPSDAPTIQAGIDLAQNGDFVLVSPGTYDENLDFKGKSIKVTSDSSSGAGAVATIIRGSDGPTVSFQSNESSSAILNGFTIEHQSPGGQTAPGEGIFISGASPTITGNAIIKNNGCGVSITGPTSSPAIRGNEISWNFAGVVSPNPRCGTWQYPLGDGIGVGIFAAGSVEISSNTIQGNNTIAPVIGSGGGIVAYNTTKLTIANNAIFGNTGGATGSGGSSSSGETSWFGGVAVLGIGDLELIQNLIYSNVVIGGDFAAGIVIWADNTPNRLASGTLTIVNNTVVNNQSDGSSSYGEQLGIENRPAQSSIENNIFASTNNGIAIYCAPGGFITFSHNDVIGSTPIRDCGGVNNIAADPKFVNAAGDDFHLTAASPSIAAGDTAAPDLPATDFDGFPRIVNGAIGLGVYEYQPVTANSPVLTSSANPSYVGQSITFTATLNTSSAKSPVTGTMSFRDGAAGLGTVNVSTAGVATVSSSSLSAGTHSIYAIYSGDKDLAAGITNTVNQVVSTLDTTTTLTASQSNIAFGQSITFTADVQSPSSSIPVTGGVVFYVGTSALGVANLNNGTASYTTSSLGAGSYTITAKFVQNQTYATSTSNAVTVTVASDFGLSATPTAQSIFPGQSAKFTITVASNSGFNLPVALSCSGLPKDASCAFSPSAIQNGVGSSQLVIQLANANLAAMTDSHKSFHLLRNYGVVAPFLCVLFLIPGGLRRRRFFAVLLLSSCIAIAGCSGKLLSLSPQSSYSIVVTGSSNVSNGLLAHSTTITLEVPSSF